MTTSSATSPSAVRPLQGLVTSCGIFVALLALPLWRLAAEYQYVFENTKTQSIAMASLHFGGPLLVSVATYAAILLSLHLAAGIACWALARTAESAFGLRSAGRRSRAALTALLACAWTLLANAYFFPNSLFSGPFTSLATRPLLGTSVFTLISAIAAVAAVGTFALAAWRSRAVRASESATRGIAGAVAAVGGVAVLAGAALPMHASPASARRDTRPDVVIVGIDSLRCNLDGLGAPGTVTPNVDRFLAQSHRFTDAMTPLARTFPAWVSILTGRHPMTTGARINLTPRDRIHEGDTLADLFAADGYRTVLATDEVRFSNIDESYGYQQLITPRIGATDFLIGTFHDIPLANLLTLHPIGRPLLPDVYANRAAHKLYRPEAFVDLLDRELESDGRPTFAVVHLTLAHWPYTWARSTRPAGFANIRPNYTDAVRTVDEQYAEVMRVLGQKGLLRNAVVVLLSDHGEAVGLPNDSSLPRDFGDDNRRFPSLFGHGNSVLGPHQYRVVLGMRAFGNSLLPAAGAVHDAPATLEDVAPTLLELTSRTTTQRQDGFSLAGVMRGETGAADRLRDRLRFTESEFKPPFLPENEKDAQKLVRATANVYRVEAATGRLVLSDDGIASIVASKEFAVLQGSRKLAALPDVDGRKFYWFDGRRPFPRTTHDPAVLAADPEAAPLLAALEARFPGEVVPH